jgi:hypothetical protein
MHAGAPGESQAYSIHLIRVATREAYLKITQNMLGKGITAPACKDHYEHRRAEREYHSWYR